MRFTISGNDKDTGQPIELTVNAADAPSAAAVADRKGICVTGIRSMYGAIPPPMPQYGPRVVEGAPRSAMSRPLAPPQPKTRIWFGLFLIISGFLAPFFPGYTLGVGIALALLVLSYLLVGPMRRGLGHLLRVSPEKTVWRVVKLMALSTVAVALMGFAVAGYAAQRAAAELAAKKASDDAARAQAETAANGQVVELVEKARVALTAGDVAKAQVAIDEALKVSLACNRGLASGLQTAIKNSGNPAWALDALARLSDADFEAFKGGGKPPQSLDLGYAVLTEKAVTNARNQIDTVVAKRAEIKKQEEEAAEARRKQAEEQRQRAIAAAEAGKKAAEARRKQAEEQRQRAIAAAEEKAAEEKTRKEASQKEVKEKLDAYMTVLNLAEVRLIDNVSVERLDKTWTATLTVKNIWHFRHYQLRYQDAQTLWKAWALIASPKDVDKARISLVDTNGNEVGGSRIWGGSLIWVQDK